ncbi:ribonuclease D [Rickettsia endosymbiont of Halotydeus destructor]|uniref:ribonuclease D n=1 Tax=Rickettsia endosymbiont of Halotydeus destructor TaxID=2996754 RepID=UPI003BB07023
MVIDNQKMLNELCTKLSNMDIISIDTEFSRRNTYYAKLSIIQVKAGKHSAIIDALTNLDLTAFNQILINDKILKLFHAPREDLEIFYHLFGGLPHNIFDIQIAADICGFGKQLSYDDLCYKVYNVSIDKTYQKANWLKRPIKEEMLNYAMQDVEYLEVIYKKLYKIITENNLTKKYNTQLQSLLDVKNYFVKPEDAWRKVRFYRESEEFITKMQILASYREEQVKHLDIPRKHFILDEDLIMLCQALPVTEENFKKLKLKSRYLHKQQYSDQIINLCKKLV